MRCEGQIAPGDGEGKPDLSEVPQEGIYNKRVSTKNRTSTIDTVL